MTNTYKLNETIPPSELIFDEHDRVESKRSSDYYITVEKAIQLSSKIKEKKKFKHLDFTPASTRRFLYSNRFFMLASLLLYIFALGLYLVWKYLISNYFTFPSFSVSSLLTGKVTASLASIAQSSGGEEIRFDDWTLYARVGGAFICIAFSALFSGLTLGLLGLDKVSLDIIATSGSPKERVYAKRILPVRRRGNLLLCTLLLGNVLVNAAITALLADLTSGTIGVIVSTALITIFGEIIPQAACSRYALFIGAHTVWIVYIIMVLLLPATLPLSIALNCVLGKEMGTIYSKEELKKLVEIHANETETSGLQKEEARILGGVLDFSKKTVEDVITPLKDCFMLEVNEKLDLDTMSKIWESGHSRIPVYKENPNNLIGLLFAKDLILVSPEDELPLATVVTFYGREMLKVFPDMHLDEMLKVFKSGKGHLAIVHEAVEPESGGDPYYQTLGIITLEDVIEEILRDEIIDETDLYSENLMNNKIKAKELSEISMFAGKKLKLQRLAPNQVIAVATFLFKSMDIFRLFQEEYLYRLIGQAIVVELQPETAKDVFLYRKGEDSNFFSVVLNGRIEVLSGADNFKSECGAWSFLGLKALNCPKFIPDFDAKVIKERTRILQISRDSFLISVKQMLAEDRFFMLPDYLSWIQNYQLPKGIHTTVSSYTLSQQQSQQTNLTQEVTTLPRAHSTDSFIADANLEDESPAPKDQERQLLLNANGSSSATYLMAEPVTPTTPILKETILPPAVSDLKPHVMSAGKVLKTPTIVSPALSVRESGSSYKDLARSTGKKVENSPVSSNQLLPNGNYTFQ